MFGGLACAVVGAVGAVKGEHRCRIGLIALVVGFTANLLRLAITDLEV
jgi:hypothetical protein